MSKIRAALSLLPSAADYRDLPRSWRGDLLAGITVGIVALPLALAFGRVTPRRRAALGCGGGPP